MLKFLLVICLLPQVLLAQFDLSICAIFQNEAKWLKEWIDYHKKIGVQHFWLYNNNSTDHYHEVLLPYILDGDVTLIEWPSNPEEADFTNFCLNIQVSAYNDALEKTKGVSKWLAIIDTDEFIVPMTENNLLIFLEKNYSYVSGLCINWQMYGTSHVKELKPGESLLRNLTMKAPWNRGDCKLFKTIVQPLHVKRCVNPHFCKYTKKHWAVTPNFEKANYSNMTINIDKIRINHYWTRDEDYLINVKVPRREKWNHSAQWTLEYAASMNEEKDECILQLLE